MDQVSEIDMGSLGTVLTKKEDVMTDKHVIQPEVDQKVEVAKTKHDVTTPTEFTVENKGSGDELKSKANATDHKPSDGKLLDQDEKKK